MAEKKIEDLTKEELSALVKKLQADAETLVSDKNEAVSDAKNMASEIKKLETELKAMKKAHADNMQTVAEKGFTKVSDIAGVPIAKVEGTE